MNNKRESGILLHISSLKGTYGIGTLGQSAYNFIDFLANSKQKIWQILPLSYIGAGNSPYNSFSAFAGNPLFIDFDLLIEDRLLSKADLSPIPDFTNNNYYNAKVQYDLLIPYSDIILHKAVSNFDNLDVNFKKFIKENSFWLDDFACFMAIKELNGFIGRQEWNESTKNISLVNLALFNSENEKTILFYKIVQFLFYKQWQNLKTYANQREIKILGDIPIYVSQDSADIWAKPYLFQLDENLDSTSVAGVPPDYFSNSGQLWGNPLYDWNTHKKDDFSWWLARIKHNLKLYDVIRIDHFRALESYWSIPANSDTAIVGEWKKTPGDNLLEVITTKFGHGKIVAEDLGIITDEVKELRDKYILPGMKILQFAFTNGFESEYLPHKLPKNCILYTGTHDNNTTTGWHNENNRNENDKQFTLDYLDCINNNIARKMIIAAMASVADTVIIPLQDWLGLDEKSRMNTPGTIDDNWNWRISDNIEINNYIDEIGKITKLYFR